MLHVYASEVKETTINNNIFHQRYGIKIHYHTKSILSFKLQIYLQVFHCVPDLHEECGFFQRLTMINKEFPGANVILHKLGVLPKVCT